MALPAPNYTQFPNVLIEQLPWMPDSAVRVSIAVARQTFGWHKKRDRISLSQLETMTNLSRPGVLMGANWLILHGYMQKEMVDPEKPSMGCYYELIVNEVDQLTALTRQAPNKHSASKPRLPEVVNGVNTQKKLLNKPRTQTKKKIAAFAAPLQPDETNPVQDADKQPSTQTATPETIAHSPLQESPHYDDIPPAPAKTPVPRPRNVMFDKLAALTHTTSAMAGTQIGKLIKSLTADHYTDADIDRFAVWWCQDWRSKGDAVPTLGQIGQLFGVAMAWADKHAPKPPPVEVKLSPEDEAIEAAKIWAEMQAYEAEMNRRRDAAGWAK